MEGRCDDCHRWLKHFYREHVDAKGMKFLKVMAGDFSDSMIISKEFNKRYKLDAAKAIVLRGARGGKWFVKFRQAVHCVFSGDGWKQFISQNHVEEGDCLLFEYNGASCFSVTVFDARGLEKLSPHFVMKKYFLPTKAYQTEEMDDDSRENTSLGSFYDSTSETPPTQKCHDNNKRKKAAYEAEPNMYCSRTVKTKVNQVPDVTHPANELNFSTVFVSKRRLVTDAERARTLKRASKTRLANPSFLTVMQPTHVYRTFFMAVPQCFAKNYIPRKKQTILLHLPNQAAAWNVTYRLQSTSAGFTGLRWIQFVYDNNLEEGDACVFELRRKALEVLIMDVHIFRVVEETEPFTVGRR